MVFHFFGLAPGAGLAALERAGRRHCAQEWEPLRAVRGAELQMDQYCFRRAPRPHCCAARRCLCAIGARSFCRCIHFPTRCMRTSRVDGKGNTRSSALVLH